MNTLHLLIVSLSLGALIGLVRQWAEEHDESKVADEAAAGMRTYSLWSLLGFVSAFLSESIVFPLTLLLLGVFGTAFLFVAPGEKIPRPGLTSFAASIGTFFVGGLVFREEFGAAIVMSCILMLLIASKSLVHGWVHRLTREDISLFVRFAAISGIILPLVPNEGYGPYEAFNPFKIWLMVVLISGLGFAGYVASRWLGAKAGITVTGIVGGLASSTATTLALSRQSRETPEMSSVFAQGIIIANVISLFRVVIIVAAIAPALATALIFPALLLVSPSIIWIAVYHLRAKNDAEIKTPKIKNPLSLKMALTFAALYALITLLLRANDTATGFYPIAFISGLTDMDAIALSLANNLSEAENSIMMAARGIILAAVANTIFKLIFALSIGVPQLRFSLLSSMVPMIATGLTALFLIN